MATEYDFTWMLVTDYLPQLLMMILFISFIVGLLVRGVRDYD